MYRRLIILSMVILGALCGLVWLGYHSIQIRAQGLEGSRLGEFAAVAEQIRQDVKRKLDELMQAEQNRPYTDYLYYYVPENVVSGQQQMPILRSPLAGRLERGLAYGYFQIEPDGNVTTPNDDIEQGGRSLNDELYAEALSNRINIKNNLLPVLNGTVPGSMKININREAEPSPEAWSKVSERVELAGDKDMKKKGGQGKTVQGQRGKALPIESLQRQAQKTQVMEQRRSVFERNIISNVPSPSQQAIPSPTRQPPVSGQTQVQANTQNLDQAESPQAQAPQIQESATFHDNQQLSAQESQFDTVEIRIEPFVSLVVPGTDDQQFIFNGQVFLLRHVQIEDRHLLQGFQLNEKKLIDEVEESAERFMREGMYFELPQTRNGSPFLLSQERTGIAYAAILDFGFGDLVLNLKEIDPAWIGKQINHLRYWYFSIIAIVLLAVSLGLAGLWRSARAQLRLAQKKDDFISAVSHELRTPLTSIRMYSEMLEKNWVKSEDKLAEYYMNMRQESERLSRLIENVLDFSSIQKGRKKYTFKVGDINKCIADVVKIMRPYAAQRGFSIKTELGQVEQTTFDSDAVTQIAVNLLDNAVKYARNAEDTTITVRTRSDEQFTLIEVEDHGPGVPHRQRKKIFEQFYRSGAEAALEGPRFAGTQTTGTGLGLALVKKFAQAHNGFVEILSAKPTGAIFRVALAAQV
jgi:signal transduction histidine kinase